MDAGNVPMCALAANIRGGDRPWDSELTPTAVPRRVCPACGAVADGFARRLLRSWLCGLGQSNLETNPLQPLSEPFGRAFGVSAVIVISADFVIHRAIANNVVGDDKHPMRDRHSCALGTTSHRNPEEQRSEIAVSTCNFFPLRFECTH